MATRKRKKPDDLTLAQRAYLSRIKNLVTKSKTFQRLLLQVQQEGKNYVGQKSRVEVKSYDPRFVEKLEEGFTHLDAIIANPRSFIKQDPTLLDAGRAKKINSETVTHLASHTQFVYDVDKEGNVTPMKLLSIESDVDYWIYENRFIATLIKKAAIFIEKRVNYIKDHGETRDSDLLLLHTDTNIDGARYEVDSRIKLSTPSLDEGNAERNEDLLHRLYSLRERCAYYTHSQFMELMRGSKPVSNPIHQTNMIVKNPAYHAAYVLWQFLDSYTELGVSYEVTEAEADYDEAYFSQIYALLGAQMLTLRSAVSKNRAIKDAKKSTRKITPKVLFTLEDETFYDGKFLYDQFPDFRPQPDTPLNPTPSEVHKERQRLRAKISEDRVKKALVDDAIEQQKAKDIAAEAAERRRKAEAEAAAQKETMRLAEIAAKRKQEEEVRRKQEEQDKLRLQEERKLEAARRKVIRKAELDKRGQPYGVEELDTHVSDGYGAVSFYSGKAPLFASPLRDQEDVKAEQEAALAQESAIEEPLKPSFADIKTRTFAEKLSLASEELRGKYQILHDHIASYGEAATVTNDKGELTSHKRKAIVFLGISGKHLKLNLALDPAAYEDSSLPVSPSKGSLAKRLPLDFRVRSDLAVRRAKALIDAAMAAFGLTKTIVPVEPEEISPALPEETTAAPLEVAPAAAPAEEAPAAAPSIEALAPTPVEEPGPAPLEGAPAPIEAAASAFPEIKKTPFQQKYLSLPSDDDLRVKFDGLREKALSYDVSERVSVKGDLFSAHRKRLVFLTISGRHIRVNLALDPKAYQGGPLPVEANTSKKLADTPLLFRVKSDLSYRRALSLIEEVFAAEKMEALPIGKAPAAIEAEASEKEEPAESLALEPLVSAPIQPEPAAEPEPVAAEAAEPSSAQGEEAPAESEGKPASFVPEIKKLTFFEKYANIDDELKDKLDALRRKACEYDCSERLSIKGDLYSAHRVRLLFIQLSGKHIKVSFALDPDAYQDSSLPVERNSGKKLADTPLLFRVRSDLSLKRAFALIEEVMAKNGVAALAAPKAPAEIA